MNIVDSSGWLEYFAEGSNADFFAPAIEGAKLAGQEAAKKLGEKAGKRGSSYVSSGWRAYFTLSI